MASLFAVVENLIVCMTSGWRLFPSKAPDRLSRIDNRHHYPLSCHEVPLPGGRPETPKIYVHFFLLHVCSPFSSTEFESSGDESICSGCTSFSLRFRMKIRFKERSSSRQYVSKISSSLVSYTQLFRQFRFTCISFYNDENTCFPSTFRSAISRFSVEDDEQAVGCRWYSDEGRLCDDSV